MATEKLTKQEKRDYIRNLAIGGTALGGTALGGWALTSSKGSSSSRGGGGGRSYSVSKSTSTTSSSPTTRGSGQSEYELFRQKEEQENKSKVEKAQQEQLKRLENERILQEKALEDKRIRDQKDEIARLDAIKEKNRVEKEKFYNNLKGQQFNPLNYYDEETLTNDNLITNTLNKMQGKKEPVIGMVNHRRLIKSLDLPDGVNWNQEMTGFDKPVSGTEFLTTGNNARKLNYLTQVKNSANVPFTRGTSGNAPNQVYRNIRDDEGKIVERRHVPGTKMAGKQYVDIEDSNGKVVERRLVHKNDLVLDALIDKQVPLIEKIKAKALSDDAPMYVEFPDGKAGVLSKPQMVGYLFPNNAKGAGQNINKNWLKTAEGVLAKNLINSEPTTMGRLQLALSKVPVDQIANIPGKNSIPLAPFAKRNLLAQIITKGIR